MYLVDTNVISESRKKAKANEGVRTFFKQTIEDETRMFISVVTVGELRRGVELIRYRNDVRQANQLENWLATLLTEYQDQILGINPGAVAGQDGGGKGPCPLRHMGTDVIGDREAQCE